MKDLAELFDILKGPLKDALKQSPTLAIVLLVAWFCYRQIVKEHSSHLKSKDDEIERLVTEKNRLQELWLKNRLTTGDGNKKRGAKS